MTENAAFFNSKDAIGLFQDTKLPALKEAQWALYAKLATNSSTFNFDEWTKEFKEFSEKYDRFLYSMISSAILREDS